MHYQFVHNDVSKLEEFNSTVTVSFLNSTHLRFMELV